MTDFPQRILVRGVNWLGDAVMSTPTLQGLRQATPTSKITLLTHEKLADLWTSYPHVDEVLTFAAGESVFSIAGRLRGKFDLALVLPNSVRSALECFLARIPRRVGYARNGRSVLLTQAIAPRAQTVHLRKRSVRNIRRLINSGKPRTTFPTSGHQVYDYLHLIGSEATAPKLHVTDKEVQRARARFFGEKLWLGLNPGAEYGPAKRWPAEQYIQAALEVRRQTGCECVVFGGPKDKPITGPIAAATDALDLTGKTTLRELAACFRVCRALLTNDTGPMHLAAAVGTPVIVPFGSTAPELTGPQNGEILVGDVPCAPCFRRECPVDFRCMRSISVAPVVEATLRAFAADAEGGRYSR